MDQDKYYKKCRKCEEIKRIDKFRPCSLVCAHCVYLHGKEKSKLRLQQFYINNKEKYQNYYQENKDKIIKYNSEKYMKKKKEHDELVSTFSN